ncbi:hypothetical protein RUM44_008224 [Polyplax serrata]|uniref:Uncharacterized protein n=1 Tax=Polyplax serrata TaxID=468196 RepID=A0ABR1BBU4_POLSC
MHKILVTCLVALLYVPYTQGESCHFTNATALDKIWATFLLKKKLFTLVVYFKPNQTEVFVHKYISSLDDKVVKLKNVHTLKLNHCVLDNPCFNKKEVQTSMDMMVAEVEKVLKKQYWVTTSVNLFASSKYKQINPSLITKTTETIRDHLRLIKFYVDESGILLLNNTFKNALMWYSVNLLLGNTGKESQSVPMAVLNDEQGRLVYEPKNVKGCGLTMQKLEKKSYTTSATPGLQEVHKRVLQPSSLGCANLETVCISPSRKFKWTYNCTEYTVRGAQPQGSKGTSVGHPSEVNYEECVSAVKKVVDEIPKPQHLCSTDIYAVSGYRKLIESVNLINKMNVGDITVQQIKNKAKEVCAEKNDDNPFLCMDLIYVYLLFENTFGVQNDDLIHFQKKIGGVDIHWSFGASYLRRYVSVDADTEEDTSDQNALPPLFNEKTDPSELLKNLMGTLQQTMAAATSGNLPGGGDNLKNVDIMQMADQMLGKKAGLAKFLLKRCMKH